MTQPSNFDAEGPLRPPGTRAPRPRDAATLILVRRDLGSPKLLMGRRSGGHDFMPHKWVFPGGRVDRSDYRAPAASELKPAVAARLLRDCRGRRPLGLARALAMAAVRETFEEAGLVLGKAAVPARRGGPPDWRAFLAMGLAPDLEALDYVARAVTPASRPKRFDARFFMADAARLQSLERLGESGELGEIGWFDLKEVEALDLPSVTRAVVREVAVRMHDPARPVLTLARGAQDFGR